MEKEGKGSQPSKGKSNKSMKWSLFLGDTPAGIKIMQFIDGIGYSIFITLITFITLFSDDIRESCFSSDYDVDFSILTIICMAIFFIQMVVLCFVKEGYFLRYYFWLDLISTVSMAFDLVWVNALISGNGIQTASKVVKIARASRVSKIGARSTKLIRILRLIRVLKLYKTAKNQLNKENQKKIAAQGGMNYKNQPAVEGNPRKTSKRMDRVRQASAVPGSIIIKSAGSGTGDMAEKRSSNKHQVSLKNIVFQGSQRRLSVLHPSQKLGPKPMNPQAASSKRFPSMELPPQQKAKQDMKSQDNVLSEYHNNQFKQEEPGHVSDQIEVHNQTKLGFRLKQQIQKNIVSMILLILLSIPLLNCDTWFSTTTGYETGPKQMVFLTGRNSTEFDAVITEFIDVMIQKPQPLVYFSATVNSTCCQFPKQYPTYNYVKNLDSIRQTNILVYVQTDGSTQLTIAFDQTSQAIFTAQLSIGRTLFVCITLIVITMLFTRDVQIQALEPLENMLDTVKKISSNPLQAIKDIEKQNMIRHAIQLKGNLGDQQNEQQLILQAKQNKKILTEPVLLENMIIKIGSLLAVGFGEAGTQLIAQNIQNYGSLNVMMPGKKIMSIFGFCDIRNFTDATEVLQSKVMVFVNQIAQICHEVVNRVGGNPNKNIGDAFLLVWKFKQDDTLIVQNRHQTDIQLRSSLKVKQTADLAVYSFVKMIAQISRSHCLQKYKHNQGLKKRIKNYEGVKMGFGLHVGWAIQGPIGSQFKIDASYLGPHVNFSGRLQAATKHYGVPMLISQQLYELMTLKNKQHLRQVDLVKIPFNEDKNTQKQVKQAHQTMGLYTVDISIQNLLKNNGLQEKKEISLFEKKKAKVFHNQQRDKLMSIIEKKRITAAIWNEDKDIKAMRQPFTRFFYDEWKRGFDAYLKGRWQQAHEIFKKTLILGIGNQDGPSQTLLNFMQETKFIPPPDWDGSKQFVG